ncbi:MAG: hypothetical protein ACYSYU_03580 [Planctomycetota bacterium]|jgi:hypothetical protein
MHSKTAWTEYKKAAFSNGSAKPKSRTKDAVTAAAVRTLTPIITLSSHLFL